LSRDKVGFSGGYMKKILFLIPLFYNSLFAGSGTTSANFLKISQSAREASLSGAYSAIADDSNAIFSNPAALAIVEKSEISLGFTSYIQDSKMGLLSYVRDFNEGKLGLGLSLLSITGIEKRGPTDSAGIVPELGSFDSNDMAIFLSYAKKNIFPQQIDNLNGGINLKFIRSKIDSSSAFALAMDLGFLYKYSDKTNISFSIFNLGTKMKYEDESDPLPLNLKAGISYKWKEKTALLAEVQEYLNDEKFYPSLAIEHILRPGFALRAGYKFGYDTSNLGSIVGFSAGFGMKVSDIGLNYAYVPFGDLGNIHRFDFQMKF